MCVVYDLHIIVPLLFYAFRHSYTDGSITGHA